MRCSYTSASGGELSCEKVSYRAGWMFVKNISILIFGVTAGPNLGQTEHLDDGYAICANLESVNPMKLQRFRYPSRFLSFVCLLCRKYPGKIGNRGRSIPVSPPASGLLHQVREKKKYWGIGGQRRSQDQIRVARDTIFRDTYGLSAGAQNRVMAETVARLDWEFHSKRKQE
jgi:hypothetical protein